MKILILLLWLCSGVSLTYKGYGLIEGWLWIVLAVAVGLLKGHFVLSKTVRRMKDNVPGLRTMLVIPIMIGLGMAVRFLPNQTRGFIDLAIGHALIYAAGLYLWYLLPRSISKAR